MSFLKGFTSLFDWMFPLKDTDMIPIILIICLALVSLYNIHRISLLSHEIDKVKMVQISLQHMIEELEKK
jgi:hypothetical protein